MWEITLKKGQKLFFISDTHYNHKNLCRGVSEWTGDRLKTTRKFDTLEKMNDTIVNNINSVVGEDDILIHLGDWSFGGFEEIEKFKNRIVCKNIYLILGNHDHHIQNNKENIAEIFTDVCKETLLKVTIPAEQTSALLLYMHCWQ